MGDAGPIYLVYAQGIAIEDDLVADLGGASEVTEDEPADGVEVLARKVGIQGLVSEMDRGAAIYRVGAVA